MSERPALSVCIPTYDRLAYLKEAVQSVQRQSVRDVEIVIGDDGNSKELADWSRSEAARDPRVVYTKNRVTLGLGGNWDACAKRARGRFLAFIGDDDRLRPEFAQKLLRASEAGADVLFSEHDVIDASGAVRPEETEVARRVFRRHELPGGRLRDPELWVWRNSIPMSSAIIRSEHAQRLGFKQDLNTPELEFFARLAREGKTFHFLPEPLSEYRSHAGSQTSHGLKVERLVKYLEPIEVPDHVEGTKRALISSLCVAGVHRLLLAGDVEAAQQLVRSKYYPGWGFDRATAQRLVSSAPALASSAYGTLFPFAKRLIRRRP